MAARRTAINRAAINRVSMNAGSLLGARVGGALLLMATLAVSAHRLSVHDFGVVTTVLAVGFLANMAVTFGTDTTLTRATAVAEPGWPHMARAALTLQLGLVALLVTAAAGLALVGVVPGVVVVQALALVPMAVVTVASAILRGAQQMVPLLGAGVAGSSVALAATAAGFAIWTSPVVPVAAIALGAIAAASLTGRAASAIVAAAAPGRALGVVAVARRSLPFAAMVGLTAMSTQGALLFVEFVADEPTGGYGVAVRLLEAARLVPAAVVAALFPVMAAGGFSRPGRMWVRRLAAYAIAATVALMLLAPPINTIVFDNQPDGAVLIRILALGLGAIVIRLVLSFGLIAAGRERDVVWSAVAGFVWFVASGAVLSTWWGAPGTAVAQVSAVVVATIWLAIAAARSGEGSRAGTAAEAPAAR